VEPALITLDTSALVTLLDRRDPDHRRVRQAFVVDGGPYLIPAWILAEIGYVAESRLGVRALDAFLGDLEGGAFSFECGDQDVPRIRELVRRYADLPLGVADAAVIACAERNGGRVLTLDVRDFGVVAREKKIELLPA
jgi:predicted nucleic acid-binding protein